jgi:hypothetical protein
MRVRQFVDNQNWKKTADRKSRWFLNMEKTHWADYEGVHNWQSFCLFKKVWSGVWNMFLILQDLQENTRILNKFINFC